MYFKPAAFLILSTVVLTLLALFFKTSDIETDLGTRVASELETKGYGWAVVKLDGRNVILDGTAPNDSFKRTAAELSETVWGVYSVISLMDVAVKTSSDNTPPPALPQVSRADKEYITRLSFGNGRIVLKGSVPSPRVKKEIVRLADGLIPNAKIIDDLTINTTSPNNWRTVFGLGFSQFSRLEAGEMILTDNMLRIKGKAWSGSAIESIRNILSSGLPDPYIAELSLDVVPPGSEVEQVECQRLIDALKYKTRIFFDSDSARIKRLSYPLLDRVSYTLKRCPEYRIRIEGHTDNRGPGERNWRLSKDRAESVKAYLVQSGLNIGRIYTRGYGEARPIASNQDREGRAMNRRIDMVVTSRKFIKRKGY